MNYATGIFRKTKSDISMKEITKKWIAFAKEELKTAEILFKNKMYKSCIYHCHQAIEKFLKAAIVNRGKHFRKTHDLLDLLRESEIKYSQEILGFIQELNPYYTPIRYPDSFISSPLKYGRKTTQRLFKLTKEVSKWLLWQIT